ncbi:tumor necrosis factor ligand superfamily member 13 isoform X1 [Hypomesus transpacificus]|uniref:tumor necrosis factor ligand superfamily member 13 isoform X1 n=1 Tax=Hypomesus transpacificus TaxID=137520 RepID=UPI001F0800B4|nr:tumor necrosis factor ligand superfamily member 13 isoform X1 [Hypomesus transpacificus]
MMVNSKPINHFHGSCLLSVASFASACICLCLMTLQSTTLRHLQIELGELRQWTGLECKETDDSISRCEMSNSHRGYQWDRIVGGREKRDVARSGKRRQRCAAGRVAVLHLQPLSLHSYDEDDYTLIKWAVGKSLGNGLQVGLSGETVTIVTEGTYFIYSQVLYKDTTWTMGHVIKKRIHGTVTSLMKCIQSMPNNITVAQNTCYTAGVHYLEPGSTLEVSVPRKSAGLVLKAHATFLGMFSI